MKREEAKRSEIMKALMRRMMLEEAISSVKLDTEGSVHTCYDGHDCKARRSGKGRVE